MDSPKSNFLTINEVSEKLNISPFTIRGLVKSGKLNRYKLGHRSIRYKLDDVELCLSSTHLQTSKSEANG